MNNFLYPCFQHWPGTIWFYSDPHFNDPEAQYFRKNKITDEQQIKNINSKVGKDGTIVFLGDIGDLEFIKKIKGYKVLIMGNHDAGKSIYQSSSPNDKLFNEVYEGCLMITDNIILSHEPVDFKYAVNIHGHDHAGITFYKKFLNKNMYDNSYNFDLDNYLNNIKNANLCKVNVCAEWINYTPINLQKIIKSGILHNIPNIHRETIDNASSRKSKRK